MNAVLAATGITAPPWLAPALFAGAMLLLIAAVVRRQQLLARRDDDGLITPAARYHAMRAGRRSGRESLRVTMADAEELAGRLTTMIDEAAGRAQRALADLEDRIQTLERLEALAKRRAADPVSEAGATRRGRAAPPREQPAPQEQGANPVEQRILELAAQGRTPIEIAKETGRPTGQVELIIALRREAAGAAIRTR